MARLRKAIPKLRLRMPPNPEESLFDKKVHVWTLQSSTRMI
jgi:hypothetical protein